MTETGGAPADRELHPRPPPGTWRLLAPAIPGWGLAAWSVVVPGVAPWVAVSAAAAGIFLCALLWRRRRARADPSPGAHRLLGVLLLACGLFTLLGARVAMAEYVRDDPALAALAESGRAEEFSVRLAGFPRSSASPYGDRYWVRGEMLVPRGSVPVLLWLPEASPPGWAPGLRVTVHGVPRRLPPGGAAYALTVGRVNADSEQGLAAGAGGLAARLRSSLREAASGVAGAELVPGFAVGDTALVGAPLDRAMRESSLGHLTAVSGANCALVTGAVIRGLARAGVGRRLRIVAAVFALLAFVVLVGPDPSVQRAAVMAAVLLASGFGGRRARALPSLGFAMSVLLISDPWQAVQPGFALSVAATAGILLAATPLSRWLRRRLRLPGWLALSISVALAAQLACGPLLLLLQPGVPAVGVLANVVAGPAAPLGTGLGLIALLLGPFGAVPAQWAVLAASLPARWVTETARLAADLPLGRWYWPEGWGGAALLTACEAAVVAAWALRSGFVSLGGSRRVLPRGPWARPQPAPNAVRVVSAGLLALSLGAAAGVTMATPVGRRLGTPADWAIVACDVGQGDALLLRDPARPSAVILVDTGDEPERLRSCLDRFGVQRIALLILSHDDRDHVGAIGEVLERVDRALISPTVAGERTADREVVRELRSAGVPARIGVAGASSRDSPYRSIGGPRWRILAPVNGAEPSDTNAASLVLVADIDQARVLLLADTGLDEQRALLAGGAELQADVLKVAHHGSRDQDRRLPAAVGAEWGLVSVGAENRYGHPTAETLAGLARAGTRALRTDLHGSIALVPRENGRLEAWVERG